MKTQPLLDFFKKESSTGILLIVMTILAMSIANSPFKTYYDAFMEIPVVVSIGTLTIAKPLLLWINDGLMAIFFFMVGLEIKREVVEGELKQIQKIAVPASAAFGGMVVPALIYTLFNHSDALAMEGWAIPTATDIAFALGILSLLGDKVPPQLKLFLLTLAIIDDLGAILIIALFYTEGLSYLSLSVVAVTILILFYMNKKGVVNNTAYILIGIVMWVAMLKSGVHATLAGVVLGLFIPIKNNKASFHALEHSLHAPVNFVILPLFAFVNTGIDFTAMNLGDLVHPMTLGIACGLLVGKTVGIFLFSLLAIRLGFGKLPEGMDHKRLFGLSILGGVGFTMSLFIGSLAFECNGDLCLDTVDERLGILLGSFLAGLIGYLVLRTVAKDATKG